MTGRDPAFAASPSSQSSLSRPSGLQSGVGFTPGPWRAHDHTGPYQFDNPDEWVGYAWVGYGGEPDGSFQGCVASLDRRKDASEEWKLRAQHDARLIAAAPELFEALQVAAAVLTALEAYQTVQVCEAALAKARGEA